jgi:diaminopimelate dehydrogenase
MEKIRAGIYGYGNIAKGIEKAIGKSNDISLVAVFTRRDPSKIRTVSGVKAIAADRVLEYKDKIDVMLLCGGSAKDLPMQTPELAKHFNTVDSFDTHAKIPEYLEAVNKQALSNKRTAIISVGWDPGLFSMMKSLFSSLLPDGKGQAFWGPGVSQGHSDAIRQVEGVKGAIQYSVPNGDVLKEMRNGSEKDYTARQKHKRLCYVVAEEGADKDKIARTIKEMPYYFSDYDTEVNFISSAELEAEHSKMPHGGNVMRNGHTAEGGKYSVEFYMRFDSNPDFTASIMVAYTRAAFRMYSEKIFGAKTALDIPLSYLAQKERKEQIAEHL